MQKVDDNDDIKRARYYSSIYAKSRQRNIHSHLLKLFLKSDSFYDEMYPALSDAIKHFKDSEKGRDEMCKSIEAYATEEAIDTAVKICIDHNDSLEDTISFVINRFEKTTREYIISRFKELSTLSIQ